MKKEEGPWQTCPKIWKTQAAFYGWLRGGLRRGIWEKSPVKLQFISDNRVRAPLGKVTQSNPDGMVWACQCNICKEVFRQSSIQVDHLNPSGSLRCRGDLLSFVERLSFITAKDLQLVCKPCHDILTLSQRLEITFEEAKLEKVVIEFKKSSAGDQIHTLEVYDIPPQPNAAKRVIAYRGWLKGGRKYADD